ncbi:hypothetical protein ABPG74_017948 [Tetrahymena malaccensis]
MFILRELEKINDLTKKPKDDFFKKIHTIVNISEREIAPNSIYSCQWLLIKRTHRSNDFPTPTNLQEQGAHLYCPSYEYLYYSYNSFEIQEKLMIIFPTSTKQRVSRIRTLLNNLSREKQQDCLL